MTHAALDEIMEEIHKDLYYFTKLSAHRSMVEDHFKKLQTAIVAAFKEEREAAHDIAKAMYHKEPRCRS